MVAFVLAFTVVYMFCTPDAFVSIQFCAQNRIRVCKESFVSIFALWKHIVVENPLTRLGFVIPCISVVERTTNPVLSSLESDLLITDYIAFRTSSTVMDRVFI